MYYNLNLCPGKLIESLEKQLSDKGAEINGYMEKHNIQLKDQQVHVYSTARCERAFTLICISSLQGGPKKEEKAEGGDAKSGGVLVAN